MFWCGSVPEAWTTPDSFWFMTKPACTISPNESPMRIERRALGRPNSPETATKTRSIRIAWKRVKDDAVGLTDTAIEMRIGTIKARISPANPEKRPECARVTIKAIASVSIGEMIIPLTVPCQSRQEISAASVWISPAAKHSKPKPISAISRRAWFCPRNAMNAGKLRMITAIAINRIAPFPLKSCCGRFSHGAPLVCQRSFTTG